MLAYFEQAADHYLELLAHSDESDSDTSVVSSKEELQAKLARATKRIEELSQLKDHIEENGEVSLTTAHERQ